MTDQELAEIEARANAATEGPWTAHHHDKGTPEPFWCVHAEDEHAADAENNLRWDEADTLFIAHARQDVPALVAEVRRLRAKVKDWQSQELVCNHCETYAEDGHAKTCPLMEPEP